jgi:hypothetical protein
LISARAARGTLDAPALWGNLMRTLDITALLRNLPGTLEMNAVLGNLKQSDEHNWSPGDDGAAKDLPNQSLD